MGKIQVYKMDILNCYKARMSAMISQHCKVLFTRFDVRFPEGYLHDGGNKEISRLMKMLKEFYAYHGVAVHYLWVREQVSSVVPHYHVIFLTNGSRIQNPMGVWMNAQKAWSQVTGGADGLIHFCRPGSQSLAGIGSIMIRRPSGTATGEQLHRQQQEFSDAWAVALERATYLAKTYSKGNAPPRIREYGASQL